MRQTGGRWVPTGVRLLGAGGGSWSQLVQNSQNSHGSFTARIKRLANIFGGQQRPHPRTQIQVRLGNDGGIATRHPTDTSRIASDKIISPRWRGLATDSSSPDVLPGVPSARRQQQTVLRQL